MSLYQDRILPHLVNLAMCNRRLLPYRERVISAAKGRVLEIGIGSGLNLPFYPPRVSDLLGLEPAPRLIAMGRRAASRSAPPVKFIEGSAEAIPLEDKSIDTVVTTWTLCTIPDAVGALTEMRRVLKPGGTLLFAEHGTAPDIAVRSWQDRLTPLWKRIAGGCHLNRKPDDELRAAGFRIDGLETRYIHGWRPFTFMYEGQASTPVHNMIAVSLRRRACQSEQVQRLAAGARNSSNARPTA